MSWPEPPPVCCVCGDPADDTNSAICNWCGLRFHLTLRQGEPGKDCGRVWVNEAYMTLEYACQSCLRGDLSPDEGEPLLGVPAEGEPPLGGQH